MRSETRSITVSVIYLIWIPYGIELFKHFVFSYKAFECGYMHQLVLLFNGVENESAALPYHQFALQQHLDYTSYYKDKGQDLEAYFWLAPQLKSDNILFLNSYSEILSENWLLKYMNVADKQDNFGVVGATGSYQSYYNTLLLENSWRWNRSLKFGENFKKYKLLLKTILLYRFYFNEFPNPHIRTTAFLVNRNVFLTIHFKKPKNKFQAYLFESGRNGFTRQLLKRKLAVSVLDKQGNVHAISQWYQSRTFWSGHQENLLVSDNQTKKFASATNSEKRTMTYNAWKIYE